MAMQDVMGIMRDLEAENKAWLERQKIYALAVEGARRSELGRICARYELESDEFWTAMQKAEQILAGGTIPPRF